MSLNLQDQSMFSCQRPVPSCTYNFVVWLVEERMPQLNDKGLYDNVVK